MSKRHTSADPTANAAVGNLTRLSQFDGQIAEDLRRRELLRQQEDAARNARLRRLRQQQAAGGVADFSHTTEQYADPTDGSAI